MTTVCLMHECLCLSVSVSVPASMSVSMSVSVSVSTSVSVSVSVRVSNRWRRLRCDMPGRGRLQVCRYECVAVCCSVLQCVAVCCNVCGTLLCVVCCTATC